MLAVDGRNEGGKRKGEEEEMGEWILMGVRSGERAMMRSDEVMWIGGRLGGGSILSKEGRDGR
jgi:hypothetical protein